MQRPMDTRNMDHNTLEVAARDVLAFLPRKRGRVDDERHADRWLLHLKRNKGGPLVPFGPHNNARGPPKGKQMWWGGFVR